MAKSINPFGDDDDQDDDKVDKARIEGFQKRMSDPVPDDDFELEPDDGDDLLDDDDKPTRQDKKRNRYREMQDRVEESERLAREAQERADRLEQQVGGFISQSRTQQEDPLKEYEDRLEQNSKEQGDLYDLYMSKGDKLTDGDREEYARRARKLRDDHAQIIYEKNERRKQLSTPPTNPVVEGIKRRHGDLLDDEQARAVYFGNYSRWRGMNPTAKETPAIFDKLADETRRDLGWERSEPTAGDRARRSASSRAGAGGGGGGGGKGRGIVMDATRKAMADAAYPHIKDPMKRYQHYVNQLARAERAKAG